MPSASQSCIDRTAPTIAGTATSSPNGSGWYNGPVMVSFTCSDTGGSGPVACPASTTLSLAGAGQSVTGSATDAAGNSAGATVSGINIDLTPPNLAPTVSPNPFLLNGTATATPNATDALSGVASQSCAAVATSSAGNQAVNCGATDLAGNSASKAASHLAPFTIK